MNTTEIATRTPSTIAAEINTIREQAKTVLLSASIEIGKRLYEAKGLVAHGSWGDWLVSNVDYSERTAQNLIRVYEEYGRKSIPQALAEISYTQAVALLGLPREEREAFAEEHDVPEMSTRELQEEIEKLKTAAAQKQVRIEELLKGAETTDAAVKKARESLERSHSAELMKAQRAQRDAEKARDELQAQLDTVPSEIPVTVAERIPDETLAELERLREVAKKAPCESVIKFRAGFDRLKAEFDALVTLLDVIARELPDDVSKYRNALVSTAKYFEGKLTAEE